MNSGPRTGGEHTHGEPNAGEPVAATPSPWVARWAPLVAAGGRVLDVASGQGRHTRFFAGLGHPVLALDRDAEALRALGRMPGVEAVCADLEGAGWPIPVLPDFAAVIVTRYLYRPTLPLLPALLAPGGVLIYETFSVGNETVGRPARPEFLLQPGELLALAAGRLRIVAYEDGYLETPRPAFVQRLCAVRETVAGDGGAPRYPLESG